jgi:hypothetical protein
VFQLLQHRALVAGGVGVAGQEQQRKPVDGCQAGGGDQVQGAGPMEAVTARTAWRRLALA